MEYVKVWSIVKVQRMVCRGKNTTCISILHLKSSLETNYDKNKKVSLINLWRNISDAALCLRLVFLQWPWSSSTGLCLALWSPFLGLLLDAHHIWGSPYSHLWEDLPWWLSHQKIGNFCPSFSLHWGLFNHIWSLLGISSEPRGRSESWYAKTRPRQSVPNSWS